jgi:hypothetical protein
MKQPPVLGTATRLSQPAVVLFATLYFSNGVVANDLHFLPSQGYQQLPCNFLN